MVSLATELVGLRLTIGLRFLAIAINTDADFFQAMPRVARMNTTPMARYTKQRVGSQSNLANVSMAAP